MNNNSENEFWVWDYWTSDTEMKQNKDQKFYCINGILTHTDRNCRIGLFVVWSYDDSALKSEHSPPFVVFLT